MNNRFASLLVVIFFLAGAQYTHAQIITTIAGGGSSGLGDSGPATACELDVPYGIALDASGNLYIADEKHNSIRKVSPALDGVISTIAGNGSPGYSGDAGAAATAEIFQPFDVAIDGSGSIYISDNYNHRIRKVNSSGIITTIAGTGTSGYNGDGIPATAAELYSPHGIAFDGKGNLLICDALNNRVRKIDAGGIITTIAGNGSGVDNGDGFSATAAALFWPTGIAIDAAGDVFIADLGNRIRKINPSNIISTVAGGGTVNSDNIMATAAEIYQPFGVAIDAANNIYISETYGYRIRKVNGTGIITTIAGTGTSGFNGDGGLATATELYYPSGIKIDASGNMFIADAGNNRIRYIRNTLSVNNTALSTDNVTIYPNPSNTGKFSVNIISNMDNNAQVIITNIFGQKIKDFLTITNNPLEIELDVPNGVYFLSAIVNVNEQKTMKLVVQR